jgi:hypothetical protein
MLTDILEGRVACIFVVEEAFCPVDGDSMFLQNVWRYLHGVTFQKVVIFMGTAPQITQISSL